jgi:hypothetical protein
VPVLSSGNYQRVVIKNTICTVYKFAEINVSLCKITKMKKLLLLITIIATISSANAQPVIEKLLKKGLTLTMPRTADGNMPGTRGACVAWHPVQKKYYAAMAGNIGYPLGVFDATGKRLSADTLNCNADVRGLWYNIQKKEMQGNSYNDYGWFRYVVNVKGIPVKTTIFLEGKNQPDNNSVGAFIPTKQQVLFLFGNEVFFYSIKGAESDDSLTINWGRTKTDGVSEEGEEIWTSEDYNSTTVVYTGIKGAELGFINTTESQIELYNIADGFLMRKLKLPDDAAINSTFNFAYANGMFWLFNMEKRTWTGYK